MDPGQAAGLEPRRGLPAAPLLLLVHGRAGGHIPAELQALATELEQRRRAPVQLLALTDPAPPRLPPRASPLSPAATLVPLLLLPGSHVRRDLPVLAAGLRRQGPLRRLPFLGSWPGWQRALAEELALLAPSMPNDQPPLLLHHPLQGALAHRYLALLECRCGAICRPATFDAAAQPWPQRPAGAGGAAVLPLALAANRLTDTLQAAAPEAGARPLLARPRLRQLLLETLAALP